MQKKTVNVLMSTYNGERFIETQLESILTQDGVNVQIYIRDDLSSDGTTKILKKYVESYNNIHLVESDNNLGACRSFFRLMRMRLLLGDYYALADQDDIWHRDKLITAVNHLENLTDKPALYHSNLRIIDSKGAYLRNSHSFPQVSNHRFSFLSECLATGCTIVYNRKLAEIIFNIKPENYSMHDVWIFCVACMFGSVIYDFIPHIDYRVHDKNVIGTSIHLFSMNNVRREWKKIFREKGLKSSDVKILLEQFDTELSAEERKMLKQICNYKMSYRNTIELMKNRDLYPISKYRKLRHIIKIAVWTY